MERADATVSVGMWGASSILRYQILPGVPQPGPSAAGAVLSLLDAVGDAFSIQMPSWTPALERRSPIR